MTKGTHEVLAGRLHAVCGENSEKNGGESHYRIPADKTGAEKKEPEQEGRTKSDGVGIEFLRFFAVTTIYTSQK
jgi:hypothetical protein